MPKCYQRTVEFPRVNRRVVEAGFEGGEITSDGGVLLLRQADRLLGLSEAVATALTDSRRQASCDHAALDLLRQRVYAIALGYEDLNDHDTLRRDVALQTAKVTIILRGDSGFCRWKLLRWCDRHEVGYLVGLAKNKGVNALTADLQSEAAECFAVTGDKVRWFEDIDYGAKSWDRSRRVIAKIECASQGLNPRYVVTNLEADAQPLYDELYCARGDMENRIKESQLDMFGDRTSCQKWWPNQFRLLLSSLAYTLVEAIRRIALKGTELAKAYVGTVRLKLFKIGAVILKNTRRVRFLLASGCPNQALYFLVAKRLAAG